MGTLTSEEPVAPFAPEPGVRAAAPTSGSLPGCRVRQVTEFIEKNLDKHLRSPSSRPPSA